MIHDPNVDSSSIALAAELERLAVEVRAGNIVALSLKWTIGEVHEVHAGVIEDVDIGLPMP